MSNQQQPEVASGVRPYIAWLRFLPLVLMAIGAVFVLTHPLSTGTTTSGTKLVGKVDSADPNDLVAHTPSATLAPVRAAAPADVVAARDFSSDPGAVASSGTTAAAPPVPAAPATLSPSAIAAQQRADDDRAAREAPLAESVPVAMAQAPAKRIVASDYDVPPPNDPFILRGTEIDVTLETSIDSTVPSGEPGSLIGFVGRDVLDYFHRVVLVPRGSKIVGHMVTTSLQPGQSRIGVIWNEIQLPNAHTIVLDNAPGIDMTGTLGFGATIDNHTRKEVLNVVAFSILAAGAQLAQPQANTGCGSSGFGCSPSVGQAIGQSVGTQVANYSTSAYNRNSQIPPTAHVVEGAQVGVMITQTLPIRPWDQNAQ